jgi:polyisoprenyl-phosphate glycosyltransferase
MKRRIIVVSPAYNEEESIIRFIDAIRGLNTELTEISDQSIELVLVDDGSTDATFSKICEARAKDNVLKLIAVRLSRNYGHQAAIFAGLEVALKISDEQSLFVVLDSDLQHPVRLIPDIVRQLVSGMDHVQMIRQDTLRGGWFKMLTSRIFYRVFRLLSNLDLPEGGSDFRGFSHRFVKSFCAIPERGRFNRALFCWMGFRTALIPYEPDVRQFGKSKYSVSKMAMLALTGISYFSSRPLIYLLGGTVATSFVACLGYLIYELNLYVHGQVYVLGWPTIIFFITFWGGLIAVGQLLIAIYLSRVFDEVKGRPVHLIQDVIRSENHILT